MVRKLNEQLEAKAYCGGPDAINCSRLNLWRRVVRNYEFHKQSNTVKITHQQLQIERKVSCCVSLLVPRSEWEPEPVEWIATHNLPPLNENDSFQKHYFF